MKPANLKSSPSVRWLALAVVMPLVVLAALALLGIRARMRAAWSAARERAEEVAAVIAPEVADDLAARIGVAPEFPDPPVPQAATVRAGDPLAGNDPAALAKLRDDPDAGLSPAGLPRRVLAALRLMELEPGSQSAEALAALATEVPSVLSATLLERLGAAARPALAKWREQETALSLRSGGEDWHPTAGGLWWVGRRDGKVAYLAPDALDAALQKQHAKLPPWSGLEFRAGNIRKAPTTAAAPVLATVSVPFGRDLFLEVTAAAPALIERDVRTQAAWTLGLLGTAVAAAGIALWQMLRAVREERRLGALKSQFVSSVSHELRAPVASIRLMADALHSGKVADGAAAEFHRLIAGEGARLSSLVENVLDFARIEENRKRYRFEETDLCQLVADTLRLMMPLAAERGLTLVPELSEVTAAVDPAAIRQALVNLLDNAIKFSPEGGTVTVSLTGAAHGFPQDAESGTLEACAPRWSLIVRDEGPGVPPAERQRIFERFHRLGNELRRETQGAGIGLSIVKHIVEGHGGKITVSGSTFVITVENAPPPHPT